MDILVWGTGRYSNDFLMYWEALKGKDEIVGYIESKRAKYVFNGKRVYLPSDLKNLKYDILVVAVQDKAFLYEIRKIIHRLKLDVTVVFLSEAIFPVVKTDNSYKVELDKSVSDITDDFVEFFNPGIVTNSTELLDYIKNDASSEKYWTSQTRYSSKNGLSAMFMAQQRMIDSSFIPLLKSTDDVIEIGCGSGDFTRYISPFVEHIDAYELSASILKDAQTITEEYGIDNISYYCGSAKEINSSGKKYDSAMMLGVLVCNTLADSQLIIKKVYDALKPEGYLLVRDSLSMSENETIYAYKKEEGYIGSYHSMRIYEEMYEDAGFKLVSEETILQYSQEPFMWGINGYLFKK